MCLTISNLISEAKIAPESVVFVCLGIFCNGNGHIVGPPLTQKLIFSANEPHNLTSFTRYKRLGI